MASTAGITITWLGHATTKIETPSGQIILIDPWVQQNPSAPENQKGIDSLDLMLITHGHFDHMGDAVQIAKATSPDVVAIFEIAQYLQTQGIEKTIGINHGGTVDWNNHHITMVEAIHSSGITHGDNILYGGTASGYIIKFENDFTLYHAGDTDVFGDMALIRDRYHPDVALLPIGGHFTMGPDGAARALRLLSVAAVIPIHYGTFPVLTGTPEQLKEAATDISGLKIVALKPGESVSQGELV